MEPNQIINNQLKPKMAVKDFFLNLGAFVALYTIVVYLIQLLFTIINSAYPMITYGYNYYGSQSISWPVAILIIFFPIFLLLQWFLSKEYILEPEKKNISIRKWLIYVTLFLSGLTITIDLVSILYYFIDGQELTTGFILKVISVFIVTLAVFLYYISDIREKMTSKSRIIWLVIAFVIVVGSIIWGFSVLGSPRTQQLLKHDQQKVNDLQNLNYPIQSFYQLNGSLPVALVDLNNDNNYVPILVDVQSGKPYEYKKTGTKTYELCAEFNKPSKDQNSREISVWAHPVGHYCFSQNMNSIVSPKIIPIY